jgi:hypothetical protein
VAFEAFGHLPNGFEAFGSQPLAEAAVERVLGATASEDGADDVEHENEERRRREERVERDRSAEKSSGFSGEKSKRVPKESPDGRENILER